MIAGKPLKQLGMEERHWGLHWKEERVEVLLPAKSMETSPDVFRFGC